MPTDVTILDARRFPLGTAAGQVTYGTLITYKVTGGNTYSVTLNIEKPADAQLAKAIADDLAARAALIGKTFRV